MKCEAKKKKGGKVYDKFVFHFCVIFWCIVHHFYLPRTWKSSRLADEMIHQLEEQGLQMAKQRQEYFGNLTLYDNF